MPYRPNTDADRRAMLSALGRDAVEDLFSPVPEELRLGGPLELPPPLSEMELLAEMEALASKNRPAGKCVSFLGAGSYDHFVPAVVPRLVGRSEFYTSYTPYQPEVSQGMLQATYEFQSLVCALTGMDVSNASVYDGGAALAEAVVMAHSARERTRVLVPETVHPAHRQVLDTCVAGLGLEIETLPAPEGAMRPDRLAAALGSDVAAVVVQHPNYLGCLEPVREIARLARDAGALLIASVEPVSLAILAPPGDWGADIAVAEGRQLGTPLNYGGPGVGLMACKKEHIRRLPGRIMGRTVDEDGRTAYCMTLQAREQHIRREKAGSNICTNEALVALAAAVYLSIMGKNGLKTVAGLCLQKAHYAADRIAAIPGFRLAYPAPFFHEFTVETPVPTARIVSDLLEQGFFAGRDLAQDYPDAGRRLLVCVTEKRTRDEIDRFVDALERC